MRPIFRSASHFRPSGGGDGLPTVPVILHFEGRINRARYWLAVLIILCLMIFALLSLAIISAFFGIATGPLTIDIVGVSASFDLDPDTAVKVAQGMTVPAIVDTGTGLVTKDNATQFE